MNWSGLTLAEVAVAWLLCGAIALWLYTRHGRVRRSRVSTLHFWASEALQKQRRRRLLERAAFLAQLAFLVLLVASLADRGAPGARDGRAVVLILDTSIWAQVQPPGRPSLWEQERREALRFVASLPAEDRVLLLRTDADVTPAVPFTTDRNLLSRAIADAETTSTVPDLPRAISLARAALGRSGGLVAYVGPGMIPEHDVDRMRDVFSSTSGHDPQPGVALRLVGREFPFENLGITGLGLERDAANPQKTHLLGTIRNYGKSDAVTNLSVKLDGKPALKQAVSIPAGQIVRTRMDLVSPMAATVEASIDSADALAADNQALVAMPASRRVRVFVSAGDAEFAGEIKAVFAANPYVVTEVPHAAPTTQAPPDVQVLFTTALPAEVPANSIIFLDGSNSAAVPLSTWDLGHPISRWVRTQDVTVHKWTPLQPGAGDAILAVAGGSSHAPLIMARERNGRKSLLVGFNPADSNLSKHPALPLLMAGAVEWMTTPAQTNLASAVPGNVQVPGTFDRAVDPFSNALPVVAATHGTEFFTPAPGIYHLSGAQGEQLISVNPPPLPTVRWEPDVAVQHATAAPIDKPKSGAWWKWLVLLAMPMLCLEWLLFYPNAKLSSFVRRPWQFRRKPSMQSESASPPAGALG